MALARLRIIVSYIKKHARLVKHPNEVFPPTEQEFAKNVMKAAEGAKVNVVQQVLLGLLGVNPNR